MVMSWHQLQGVSLARKKFPFKTQLLPGSSLQLIGGWCHDMTILKIKCTLKSKNDILNGKYSKYVDILENLKCYPDLIWLLPSQCVGITKFIFRPRFITKCHFDCFHTFFTITCCIEQHNEYDQASLCLSIV